MSSAGAPGPAITTVGAVGWSGSCGACRWTGATAVHGAPPSRPSGHPGSAGVSGSAKGRLRCTGPGGVPHAAATARSTAARTCVPPTAGASRTAEPNIPTCAMVWLAPVPTSSAGRSAVTAISGTPLWEASRTAGSRFAAAVPDVVATGTGRPDASARPRARNPAVRSSMRTCRRRSPAASAACSAKASGALREPGHSTASVTPHRTSSSTTARAVPVEAFITLDPASTRRSRVGARGPGRRLVGS